MSRIVRLRGAVIPVLAIAASAFGCTQRIPLLPGVVSDGAIIGPGPTDTAPGADRAARDDASPGLDPDTCQELIESVPVQAGDVEILVALDRSWSMMNRRLGDHTRLQTTRSELLALIKSYQGAIAFGYEEYPAKSC